MISLPTNIVALLEEGRLSVRDMLRAELASGAAGLWTGAYAATHGGLTYTPMHGNMACEAVPGGSDLRADQMRVTLAGISTDALALVADGEWHQRPATVMRAYVDDADLILHVETVFSGFIDTAPRSDAAGDVSTIVVTLEDTSRELDRSSGRTYSDADQRAHGDNTDGFLKHLATSNANTDIYWGQATPA